ncbi:MAG: DUF2147 domain-containing protein [Betaproteobacteria bacterium]
MYLRLLVPALASIAAGLSLSATAQSANPAGLWRTIDDASGKPRAEVRITVADGTAEGRVVRSLVAGEKPDARCDKCSDARKGQPIIGMAMLTGLRQDAGDPRVWSGGEILDPDNGTVYRARIELSPDGREMQVRGFVGIALFGRTQVWQRAE